MAITFLIPGYLRAYTEQRSEVVLDLPVSTAGQALEALWHRYPGLQDRIVDERGGVRQHVNIFVGEDNIRDIGGFAARVNRNCSIMIVPAVSGGSR